MRRFAAILCLLTILAGALPGQAAEPIQLMLNGHAVSFRQEMGMPFLLNGRVMIPLRVIGDLLEADVEWIPNPRSVRLTKDSRNIMVIIDKMYGVVDGKQVPLDAAAGVYDGRTYVPLRFIGEAFGLNVRWDPEQQLVTMDEGVVDDSQEGRVVQLTLEALPLQGAEVTVRVALIDVETGAIVETAATAAIELHHLDTGTSQNRPMLTTEEPGVFVAHLALNTEAEHTFKLRAVVTADHRTQTQETEVTVLPNDDLTQLQFDSWAFDHYQPKLISPVTDLDTDLRLPASIRVEGAPSEREEGDPLELWVHILDAYLKPISGMALEEVMLLQTAPDGEQTTAYATEVEPGLYVIRTTSLYGGYGVMVTWEVTVSARDRVLNKLRGEFMTR